MTDIDIGKEIKRAIQKVIDEEITREMENVQQNVEARVRGKIGSIVTRVFDVMSFERMGQTLTIQVNFPKI